MTRREQTVLTVLLITLDALMVAAALLAAYYVRVESGWLPARPFSPVGDYMRSSLAVVPLYILIFGLNRLYDLDLLLEGLREYFHIVAACSYGLLALILTAVATSPGSSVPARGWLVLAWLFSIAFVSLARFAVRRTLQAIRGHGRFLRRVLIVGANAHGQALANQFRTSPGASVEVVGFVDDFLPIGARVGDFEVLGGPSLLHQLAGEYNVREVILISTAVAWETFQNLVQQTTIPNGYDILLSPGYYEILTTGVEVSYRDFVPLLRVNKMRLTGPDAVLKATLDYCLAAAACILLAPLAAALALAIRLTSHGPILERHRVWGVQGSSFTTYKFNTASGRRAPRNPAPAPGPDPMLAHLILRLGLDKLPQLINIVAGHMSVVGPRTISHNTDITYEPALANLLTVKPGITGPWAVGGERSFEEEMRLTTYYIRNWTIWMDVQILWQTVVRILRGERAKAQLPYSEDEEE